MKGNYLIIGASGGIGLELQKCFSMLSCNLLLGVHKTEIKSSSNYELCYIDATNFDSVNNFISVGLNYFGNIDGIVHLVGNLILKPAHLATLDDFENTININLKSSFAVVRAAGKMLQNTSIVLMSTAAASIGLANHELICMAKSGVEGLIKSASKTYAKKNIRINSISPGLVDTPLTQKITQNPIALKASEKMHALGRIGKPKHISSMIRFLLHKENNWITGQNFIVDGGLSSTK